MAIYDVYGNKLIRGRDVSEPWETCMHRGYSSNTVYENTLEAAYRAYLNGADWVEVDAHLSSDGVYISNHDATITVGGTTYTIANESVETLTNLVLSVDPEYGDCHVPTLESLLKMCCFTGLKANIDCKAINATTLAQLVIKTGMSGRASYANCSVGNAATILSIDKNASFIFRYSSENLSTWESALTDSLTRANSIVWERYDTPVTDAMINAIKAKGFRFMMTEVTKASQIYCLPDLIEFGSTVDSEAVNKEYVDSVDLGL